VSRLLCVQQHCGLSNHAVSGSASSVRYRTAWVYHAGLTMAATSRGLSMGVVEKGW
jgi:hypothetical protein